MIVSEFPFVSVFSGSLLFPLALRADSFPSGKKTLFFPEGKESARSAKGNKREPENTETKGKQSIFFLIFDFNNKHACCWDGVSPSQKKHKHALTKKKFSHNVFDVKQKQKVKKKAFAFVRLYFG